MNKKNKKQRKASQRPKAPKRNNALNNRQSIGQVAGAVFELQSSFGQLIMSLQERLGPIAEAIQINTAVNTILAKEAMGRDLTEGERDALAEFVDGPDEEPNTEAAPTADDLPAQ